MSTSTYSIRPAARATAGSAPRLRLTARGRVLVVALLVAAVFAACIWWGSPTVATGTPHHPSHVDTVVVQPGDTLWRIAGRVAPGRDPRQVVGEIEDLNALGGAGDLRAGQPLYVPAARGR